jgi:hypothetical protein
MRSCHSVRLAAACSMLALLTSNASSESRRPHKGLTTSQETFGSEVLGFGALCDGHSDDSAALQAAFDKAPGTTLTLPHGRTCRVTTTLHLRRSLEIVGSHSTLLCDVPGVCVAGERVRLALRGIALDGNFTAATLVELVACEFSVLESVLERVYSRDAAKAFSCWRCLSGEIRRSVFAHIYAVGNGLEGDRDGASRGLFFSGATGKVAITNNSFSDIHTVTSDGTPIMEDADAIHCYGGRDAYLTIDGNTFDDIGKRAIKFDCNYATASNNNVISRWSDPRLMMFSAISVYGNHVTVTGNRVLGTFYQHGIEVGLAGKEHVQVERNAITPSASLPRTGPYGRRSGVIAIGQRDIRIESNVIQGFYFGVLARNGTDAVVTNNLFKDNVHAICADVSSRARSSENILRFETGGSAVAIPSCEERAAPSR